MSRFDGGFVFSYRKELNEDIFKNVILWGIWNALTRMATYKPSQIIWEGKPRKLEPGSIVFSPRELAEQWHLSKSVVIKWLHYLEKSGRIVIESCPRGTLITICNWGDFQNVEQEACSQRVHNEDTTCSQRVHNETLSKELNKERTKEHNNPIDVDKNSQETWEEIRLALLHQYPWDSVRLDEAYSQLRRDGIFHATNTRVMHPARFIKASWHNIRTQYAYAENYKNPQMFQPNA